MSFPSPASYCQESADHLPALSTDDTPPIVYMRVQSPSMVNANIPKGALLIVNKTIAATSGMIIVAMVNGEFLLRRMIYIQSGIVLHADNPSFNPLKITKEMQFEIFGVVTKVIIDMLK